jgi:hypothetical protein
MAKELRCVVILSSKSSGSSALQRLLCTGANARHVEFTRHAEYETLYWTKAASILGLPQSPLHRSEVPIAPRKAKADLISLLAGNAPEFAPSGDERTLVFEGWRALCRHYAPLFVEKSPHHLHQWSCLALMAEAAAQLPEIDFRFIGLVRNPMDMIYSAWSRWRLSPQKVQFEWLEAHRNLLRFRDLVGERLTIVNYESLATDENLTRTLCDGLRMGGGPAATAGSIHRGSLLKWRGDRRYGFQLDPKVAAMAETFGYTREQLANNPTYRWKLHYPLMKTMQLVWFQPKRHVAGFIRARSGPRSVTPRLRGPARFSH